MGHRQLGQNYSFLFEGLLLRFQFEYSRYFFEFVRVISKNNIEGQQSHNFQEVHM